MVGPPQRPRNMHLLPLHLRPHTEDKVPAARGDHGAVRRLGEDQEQARRSDGRALPAERAKGQGGLRDGARDVAASVPGAEEPDLEGGADVKTTLAATLRATLHCVALRCSTPPMP
jgi:hypothetical protein